MVALRQLPQLRIHPLEYQYFSRLGSQIKQHRQALGLTQRDAAQSAWAHGWSVEPNRWYRMEDGRATNLILLEAWRACTRVGITMPAPVTAAEVEEPMAMLRQTDTSTLLRMWAQLSPGERKQVLDICQIMHDA